MSDRTVIVSKKNSLQEARESFEKACGDHKFGILHQHDIQQTMKSKGFVDNTHTIFIYEICQAPKANALFLLDFSYADMLPCKVTVAANKDGSVTFSYVKPTACIRMFGPGIHPEAVKIIEETEPLLYALVLQAAS